MEERVRFELTVAFTTPAFQAGALDRYATAPCVAERTGLEPANGFPRDGLASRCLTIRLPIRMKQYHIREILSWLEFLSKENALALWFRESVACFLAFYCLYLIILFART